MFFSKYYVELSSNETINLISYYKNIRNKFVSKYIEKKNVIKEKKLYSNALTYSKYYLYWKIYGCVYSDEIMNVLYDIEFLS